MSYLFSCFLFYSFIGFLIEVLFSRFMREKRHDRKCFFLSPLCPVYGFGAISILALPAFIVDRPGLLFLAGALTATLVEYFTAIFYEYGVGVKFWDYSDLKANIGGRVCLLFSVFWGLLACLLVYGLHPIVRPFLASIPPLVVSGFFILVSIDAIFTMILLHTTGDRDRLKWYVKYQRAS